MNTSLSILTPAIVPIETNPAGVYLRKLAPGSRRTMRESLDVVARELTDGVCDALTLPWWALRYQHTSAIVARLAKPTGTRPAYSPASCNKMIAAMKGALKQAWLLHPNLIDADSYQRAINLEPVKGERLPSGRALEVEEMRSLFQAANGAGAIGIRDAAVLAVMYGAILRRSEVVALNLADYEATTGHLSILAAKGNKDRQVPLGAQWRGFLDTWLAIRGDRPGALFYPVRKNSVLVCERMTDQAVYAILRKCVGRSGVKSCSPHDFRRTGISDMIDAGADLAAVQDMAGHADLKTTLRYDRRRAARMVGAAALLTIEGI